MTNPDPETEPEGHLAAAKHAVAHALHEMGEGFVDLAVEQHERWEAAGERAEEHQGERTEEHHSERADGPNDDRTEPEPGCSDAAGRN